MPANSNASPPVGRVLTPQGEKDHETRRRREVRAGPGDAGAQDEPRVLPKTKRPKRSRTAWIVFFVLLALGAIVSLVTASLY